MDRSGSFCIAAGLRNLVGSVRKIQEAMGDGVKRIIDDELPVAAKLKEHLEKF